MRPGMSGRIGRRRASSRASALGRRSLGLAPHSGRRIRRSVPRSRLPHRPLLVGAMRGSRAGDASLGPCRPCRRVRGRAPRADRRCRRVRRDDLVAHRACRRPRVGAARPRPGPWLVRVGRGSRRHLHRPLHAAPVLAACGVGRDGHAARRRPAQRLQLGCARVQPGRRRLVRPARPDLGASGVTFVVVALGIALVDVLIGMRMGDREDPPRAPLIQAVGLALIVTLVTVGAPPTAGRSTCSPSRATTSSTGSSRTPIRLARSPATSTARPSSPSERRCSRPRRLAGVGDRS
jgi:hypothetical protein